MLAAMSYIMYHTVQGDNGLLALSEAEAGLAKAQQEALWVSARRAALERRISLARDASLDRDLLDELARRELGYAHPLDVVIPLERERLKGN